MITPFPFVSAADAARWDSTSATDIAWDLGAHHGHLPARASAEERAAWWRGRESARRVKAAERERALWARRQAGYEPRH